MSEIDAVREIVELKERYVRAVDAKRWSELEACLVPRFVFEGQLAVTGAGAFAATVMARLADAVTMHTLGKPEIDVESATDARGVWPFADVIDERRHGTGLHRVGHGLYKERYVCQDDHWLIASMRIERDRIECAAYVRGEVVRRQTCRSEAEVVAWLRREQG